MGRHKASPKKLYRHDMGACLREIFSPACGKRLHQAAAKFDAGQRRWQMRDLLWVGLGMVLLGAGRLGERFEVVREWLIAWRPKRRRCGKTLAGFLKALTAAPQAGLDELKRELQRHLGAEAAQVGRHRAFGLDGSEEELPRTAANEAQYAVGTRGPETAQALVTAAFALGRLVLWDWLWGTVKQGERELGLTVVQRLPAGSLVVTDAGFVGYEWVREVLRSGQHVLLRVGGNCRLWTLGRARAEWRDGAVWLWPEARQGAAPLRLRLIRLERQRAGRKSVVWLLTDLLTAAQLTRAEARDLFGRRWGGNEIGNRSWKRTLGAAKLMGRTPSLAQREGELTLLGLQWLATLVLQARRGRQERRRGARAARPQSRRRGTKRRTERKVSIAAARRVWCRALRRQTAGKPTGWVGAALSAAVVDEYKRKKPKQKREWAKRKAHESPGDPKLRPLPKELKELGKQLLAAAG